MLPFEVCVSGFQGRGVGGSSGTGGSGGSGPSLGQKCFMIIVKIHEFASI